MMHERRKKILMILAIAVPVLVWRVAALTRYMPSAAQASAPVASESAPIAAPTGTVGSVAPEDLKALLVAQAAIESQPWGRDPFASLQAGEPEPPAPETTPVAADVTPPSAPKLRFSAVSKSGDRWMAMVDGQFLGVGDEIEKGLRVTAIRKGSVTLESGGWRFVYELGNDMPTVRHAKGAP